MIDDPGARPGGAWRSAPRSSWAAVVWDYDGTLVATRFADEAAVAELVRQDPSARNGVELFWSSEGRPLVSRVELAWPGRAAEVMPIFSKRVRPHRFREIASVLDELRGRGIRLAVVSSRRRDPLDWGLRACDLRRHFESVVALEDVSAPKPDPEGLLLALRRIGVPPSGAVYVGDSDVDLEAGRRAAVTTWRATWAASAAPVTPAGPFVVRRPREVLERVDAAEARAG